MTFYRRCLQRLVIIVSVFLLLACAANDELEESSEPVDLEKFDARVKLKKQWSRGVGSGQGEKYHRLSIGYGGGASQVCAAAVNGVVSCYSAQGKRLWKTRMKEKLSAGAGLGEGLVLIATANGEVVALSAEQGEQLWRVDVAGEVLSAPQADDSIVVVQTYDGRVLGLNAIDGEQLWTYTSDVPLLTLRGTATPTIDNGVVYTGLANGKLIALALQNGDVLWDKPVAIAKGQSEIERIVDVDATPLVTDSAVYSASFQGYLFAFSAKTGKPAWRFETSTYRELAQGFDNIYLVNDKSQLLALDARSGDVRWQQDGLMYRELSAPTVFAGFLVVADYKGYMHVLSQVDGSIVGRKRVDSSGVRVPLRVIDDKLFAYANDGKLASYDLRVLSK